MRIMKTGVALAVAAALAPVARAEQAAAPNLLEEIVVTAQKREASLQDVPFSVSATSETQLRSANVNGIVDLARNVASLSISDLGPGQSQLAIRGISAGQVIRDQPGVKEQVGVYLDESPISIALFTPDLELFDLERFEVLRGPQGTLFGAGSLSGTLRYITQKPKLGAMEGVADVSFAAAEDGEEGGYVRGAVNFPLGETVALRVVGYYNRLPGFIDAIGPGGAIEEDVNGGERTGGRLSMLLQPSDQLSITPRIVYQELTTDGFPREDVYNILANPFTTTQPRVTIGADQQYRQLREGIDDDFRLADLTIAYDFGGATLTSITSYTNRDVLVTRDATQLTGSVTFDFGAPAAVRLDSTLLDKTELESWSEELRLASNGDDGLEWLVGAFYQQVDREYGQSLPTPGWDAATGLSNVTAGAPADSPYNSNVTYDFKQFAVFGEATYRFTEQWSLTAGLRYYDFTEDRTLLFRGQFVDPAPSPPVSGSTDSNGFTPRVILGYRITEDAQFSLQAARGFRLGGINDPINLPLCSPADRATFGGVGNWDDEKTWNYELGGKFRFADRRATFNVAAFYTDIENLQATVTAGTCSSRIIYNVPDAHSAGVEAELFARLTDQWDVGLSATWVDAALDSSVVSTSAAGVSTVVGGLADGTQLPTAPEFQAVASLGYTLPMNSGREFFANLTWQFLGSSYAQFENTTPNFGQVGGTAPGAARLIPYGSPPAGTVVTFDPEVGSYDIGNLRAGVRGESWEVAAYVSNVTDERAHLALDYERGRSARVGYLVNPPRTYGISLRKSF